jgi:multiple sugar transport system permease protein
MSRLAGHVLLIGLAALFLAPVGIMVAGSLKPDDRVLVEAGDARAFWPEEASLRNYRAVFERVPFGRFLINSLIVNGCIVALGLVVNSLAGYALRTASSSCWSAPRAAASRRSCA